MPLSDIHGVIDVLQLLERRGVAPTVAANITRHFEEKQRLPRHGGGAIKSPTCSERTSQRWAVEFHYCLAPPRLLQDRAGCLRTDGFSSLSGGAPTAGKGHLRGVVLVVWRF